jgi:hypothetical protein
MSAGRITPRIAGKDPVQIQDPFARELALCRKWGDDLDGLHSVFAPFTFVRDGEAGRGGDCQFVAIFARH